MVSSPAATAPPKFSAALHASLLSLGKAVRATKHDDRTDQRAFLDEKVVQLETFLPYVNHIARDNLISEIAFQIKNTYHQTALGGGVITEKYSAVVKCCNKLKNERERARNHILLNEQVHRAKLEDACTFREETRSTKEDSRHSKESSHAAKEAKKRDKEKSKAKKARHRQAHSDDEGSIIFDDADLVDNNSEVDDTMLVDDPVPELISTDETAPAATSTQSVDNHVLVSALSEPFVVMDNISGFIPPFSLSDALMPDSSLPQSFLHSRGSEIEPGTTLLTRILRNNSSLPNSVLRTIESNLLLQRQLRRASRVNSRLLGHLSDWKSQTSTLGFHLQMLSSAINSIIASTSLKTSSESSILSITEPRPMELAPELPRAEVSSTVLNISFPLSLTVFPTSVLQFLSLPRRERDLREFRSVVTAIAILTTCTAARILFFLMRSLFNALSVCPHSFTSVSF
ncbi:hypothetical protein B0H13DRAFT_2338491 [Mycena leptocephala]|nr:hypothetical protein B0H13DRAFT_2338491 [Mycena leptocephala]